MSTPQRTVSRSSPVTPAAQTPKTPASDPTGSWRHPKLDEIARRKHAATFGDANLKNIGWNAVFLAASFLVRAGLDRISFVRYLSAQFTPYADWVYVVLRLIMVYNIGMALMPLFRRPDDISDIPLTPGQRKLLGLPPSSSKPTPEAQYITPPRYPRSSSGKISSPLASPSGSPSARYSSESPIAGTPRGSSPFQGSGSFQNGSPLLQKAMAGGGNGNMRPSYGSPSPLGPSLSRVSGYDSPGTPGSPSPAAAKSASVGLNSRWLYEKGRRSSGSGRMYS